MTEAEPTAEKDVPDLYICPTTGETESRTMGGFDVCCGHPRCPGNLYRPIPPGKSDGAA